MRLKWTIWIYISALFAGIHGQSSTDIQCGQSTVGNAARGQLMSFQFANDHTMSVQLGDTNNTFVPVLTIKDEAGRFIDSAFAADCANMDCDGKVFEVRTLPPGVYTVEMIPNEDGGDYKVDMMCYINGTEGLARADEIDGLDVFQDLSRTNGTNAANAFGGSARARFQNARRLTNAFGSDDIEEWIDNLDDDDVDYFYNLLMNGHLGDIMEAFEFDAEYGDYGEHEDHDRYYRAYFDDEEGGGGSKDDPDGTDAQKEAEKFFRELGGGSGGDEIVSCTKQNDERCSSDKECCQIADAQALEDDAEMKVICREKHVFLGKTRCLPTCRTTNERCNAGTDCCSKICAKTKKGILKGQRCQDNYEKAVIKQGVEDVSTKEQKSKGITWMQVQKPWSPEALDQPFRKIACADKTKMFVVECSGGCEGTEYIKLGADVIEGVIYCGGNFFDEDNYSSCNRNSKLMMTGSRRKKTEFSDEDEEVGAPDDEKLGKHTDKSVEEARQQTSHQKEKDQKQLGKNKLKKDGRWRKRGHRTTDNNIGRVICAHWGSCARGALFALQNFKYGVVQHPENANGCKFTFTQVDIVSIEINNHGASAKDQCNFDGLTKIQCLDANKPPRNEIMTQMVQQLSIKADKSAIGAFREYTVDTRGVFGTVDIQCLAKDSCKGMRVLFQESQNYGYENGEYNMKHDPKQIWSTPTAITITCAFEACYDLLLIKMNDPPIKDKNRRPKYRAKDEEHFQEEKTIIEIKLLPKDGSGNTASVHVNDVWHSEKLQDYKLRDVMPPNADKLNPPRKIRMVRDGHQIVGIRPNIDCMVKGLKLHDALLLVLENYSQLEMSLRWQKSSTSDDTHDDTDLSKTKEKAKQVLWSGNVGTKIGNVATIGGAVTNIYTAADEEKRTGFKNKVIGDVVNIKDVAIKFGNLNFKGAKAISPQVMGNLLHGTLLVGELAASVIAAAMNPVGIINVLKNVYMFAEKWNRLKRQERVETTFLTEWYYDKYLRQLSEKALARIEKARTKAQKTTKTTITEQLMRETLTPRPVWHDKCEETTGAKTKTVLSGGSGKDAWKLDFNCKPATDRCLSHSECCDKRCHGLDAAKNVKGECNECKKPGETCTSSFECCTLRCEGSSKKIVNGAKKTMRGTANAITALGKATHHIQGVQMTSGGAGGPMHQNPEMRYRSPVHGAPQDFPEQDIEKKHCKEWID